MARKGERQIHSAKTLDKMSKSMIAYHERKRLDEEEIVCDRCGVSTARWWIDRFRGEWVCGKCINLGMEPLSLESFIRRPVDRETRLAVVCGMRGRLYDDWIQFS